MFVAANDSQLLAWTQGQVDCLGDTSTDLMFSELFDRFSFLSSSQDQYKLRYPFAILDHKLKLGCCSIEYLSGSY